jgi:Arc/MetJ-type ribon-helix-helix transcriptional regulator
MMYGMGKAKKTTIYLPDRLKRDIERVAQNERRSEADVIRDAVENSIYERRAPEPRIPLVSYGLGAPDIAERAEELLDGFGR